MNTIPNRSRHFDAKTATLQVDNQSTLKSLQTVNYQQLTPNLFDPLPVRTALTLKGFGRFKMVVSRDFKSQIDALTAAFGDLPFDPHDKRKTRRRAYQKLVMHPWDRHLAVRPVSTYFQEPEFNAVDGGTPRVFASLGRVANNEFLQALIQNLFTAIPLTTESLLSVWDVGIHFVRMEAREGLPALASPPYPHKDGEPITCITVISRKNIVGGRTIICKAITPEKNPKDVLEDCVLEPFETAMVVDSDVFHHVTDVEVVAGMAAGHRDVILTEFTPFRPDLRRLVLATS